jgi:hypothetical protein
MNDEEDDDPQVWDDSIDWTAVHEPCPPSTLYSGVPTSYLSALPNRGLRCVFHLFTSCIFL